MTITTAGTRVEVYKNLHKSRAAGRPVYSIRDAKSKRVVGHSDRIVLAAASFRVSEAGRQRVLRERAKNVHAWVTGTLVDVPIPDSTEAITYNPFRAGTFTVAGTERPVYRADVVELSDRVLAWNIR